MENASKALIIAGSVILAVLIIVLAFYFFNLASGVGKSINMSEYEIQAYNSKFINFEGKVSGTKAREFCDVVKQHNIVSVSNKRNGVLVFHNNVEGTTFNAQLATTGMNTQIEDIKSTLKTGKFYEIKLMYDAKQGIVTAANILDI